MEQIISVTERQTTRKKQLYYFVKHWLMICGVCSYINTNINVLLHPLLYFPVFWEGISGFSLGKNLWKIHVIEEDENGKWTERWERSEVEPRSQRQLCLIFNSPHSPFSRATKIRGKVKDGETYITLDALYSYHDDPDFKKHNFGDWSHTSREKEMRKYGIEW